MSSLVRLQMNVKILKTGMKKKNFLAQLVKGRAERCLSFRLQCWVWLIIAIALFLVTGFLLSRHGRKKQKPKVQNKEVQLKVEAETEERYSKTNSEYQSQVESNYQPIGETSITFGLYEFERYITGLKLGAFIGIGVSGLAFFVDEPALNTFSFLSFTAIAFTISDMNKAKKNL